MMSWQNNARDAGLLALRAGAGLMIAIVHGWPKLTGFAAYAEGFVDPIGIGPFMSLVLITFAEFFCALFVALGLFTRVAAVPLVIGMLVAALVVHADDPWGKKELAFFYALVFASLAATGPGRFALDHVLQPRLSAWWRRRRAGSPGEV